MIKETSIYVPQHQPPYNVDNWYENLLGRVIKPVTEKYVFDFFFFTRYSDANGHYIQLRYLIVDNNIQKQFEDELNNCAVINEGCSMTQFTEYKMVEDVGSGRHIRPNPTNDMKKRRANINAQLYHQISLLALDCLNETNKGNFQWEENPANDIPIPSSFATPHHIYCNITQIPLYLWIFAKKQNGQLEYSSKTYWCRPDGRVVDGDGNEPPNEFWKKIEANF